MPAPAEPAPRSTQALAGTAGVAPTSIDSRATDGAIPDPRLHQLTIAEAIALGKPTVVVIATPLYCVSRFWGPSPTSSTAWPASTRGRRASLTWRCGRNFEANQLNAAAADWIVTSDGGAEPWVFLLDGKGTVVRRWDNVANGADLGKSPGRADRAHELSASLSSQAPAPPALCPSRSATAPSAASS